MTAEYFDGWYADMAASAQRDEIVARALGLPPELRGAGVLTREAVDELTAGLRLPAGGTLLDVACGRGAYGIEVARRTGAVLTGVDFSQVALEQARATAADRLPAGRAAFRPGTLLATGLPDGVADGLMCVDAVQFAVPQRAALREFHRLLAPGGRLVLTCWAATVADDERVPPRIRAVDLATDLPAAGFTEVVVQERPGWRRAERTLWEQALAAGSTDPAVRSLQDEGRRSLEVFDAMRRVVAFATRRPGQPPGQRALSVSRQPPRGPGGGVGSADPS